MEIKNESLRKMLALAAETKAKEQQKEKEQELKVIEKLPTIMEDTEVKDLSVTGTFSLSLDPDKPITKERLIENTSLAGRVLSGNPESFSKAKRKVGRLTTGSAAAVPIICKGDSCPFRTKCPYFEERVHQLGEDCLVEAQLIEYWTYKYMEELDIDTSSISEMHTLSSLVELAIMDLRMSNYIAINDQALMMDFIASVDPNGVPLTNKGTSVAFEVKERIDRRRLKILETFNNTREKKAKLLLDAGATEIKSTSRSIIDKLEKLAESVQNRVKTRDIYDAEVVEIK